MSLVGETALAEGDYHLIRLREKYCNYASNDNGLLLMTQVTAEVCVVSVRELRSSWWVPSYL